MAHKKQIDLTNGEIYKVLTAFVLPIILGSMIQQLYTTADAVIVGQFTGKAGLAAIDSVHTLFKFPINFMNGLAAGATILISRHYGAGERKSLEDCVSSALTLALFLGVICAVLGVVFTPQLIDVMQVPADIRIQTITYTRIYFGGLWAVVLYNMTTGVLRSFGNSRGPMYILICCAVANILADLLFVGAFDMGVQGAAIATVSAQAMSAVLTFVMLRKSRLGEEEEPIHLAIGGKKLRSMVVIGIPLALQSMLFPIANSIVQVSVNQMGTDAIAAWGICDKLYLLIWLISDSMSPALTTFTAQNLGAKRPERVRKGVFLGAGMSMGAVCIISLILYAGAGFFGGWFVNGADAPAVVPLVWKYARMSAPFFLFYAMAEAFSGACCGTGDTLKPMLTTLTTICLLRVLAIWFILPYYNSMECIVWIYIASWIAAGISFLSMYLFKTKKLGRYPAAE